MKAMADLTKPKKNAPENRGARQRLINQQLKATISTKTMPVVRTRATLIAPI